MDIKILVATHKKCWMPEDKVYYPILLGAALRREDWGYQRDDEGDNISNKQPNYSDITALYWGWKNLDAEYIGLCHYRRYFAKSIHKHGINGKRKIIFHKEDYEKILQTYDMILSTKYSTYPETVREQYENAHNKQDLDMVERIIREKYPQYIDAFMNVMAQYEFHICNLFVAKKELIDQYCEWLFPILLELEKHSEMKTYNEYQARVCGYMAERLFNVWLATQNIKIYESNFVLVGESYWEDKKIKYRVKNFLKDKIQKIFYGK